MHTNEAGCLVYSAEESREGVCPLCGFSPLEITHDTYEGVEYRFDHWSCQCGAEGSFTYRSLFCGLTVTAVPFEPAKPRRYRDGDGNIYYLHAGIGATYKGFRESGEPGCRKMRSIEDLRYLKDKNQAQWELDVYAVLKELIEIKSDEEGDVQ